MDFCAKLDVDKILQGQSKNVLKSIFTSEYPDITIGKKIPLYAPYDHWFLGYRPKHEKIKKKSIFGLLMGKRSALVYSVERYLEFLEKGPSFSEEPNTFIFRNSLLKPVFIPIWFFREFAREIKGFFS